MSNQIQSPTQEKKVNLGRKYVKRHHQQNNLIVRQPQFLKISTKNN